MIKFKLPSKNWVFGKLYLPPGTRQLSQYLKIFLMRSPMILTNVIFFNWYHKMCQHLGNVYNSIYHYFPNHAFVKRVKVQDRPVDLNVTQWEKLIDIDSSSTQQLNFKKLSHAELWCNIEENIRNYFKRQLKYSSLFQLQVCIRLDFLHLLQPNNKSQQIECRNKVRLQLSSISQTLKRVAKMHNATLYCNNYFFIKKCYYVNIWDYYFSMNSLIVPVWVSKTGNSDRYNPHKQ